MARKITEISPLRTFLGYFLISVHSITAVSLAIMIIEKPKEVWLMKQKYYLALTTEEWRLMIESLNNLRNWLISEGRYTDAVDEVLIKVPNAKTKKFKITERGVASVDKGIHNKTTKYGLPTY